MTTTRKPRSDSRREAHELYQQIHAAFHAAAAADWRAIDGPLTKLVTLACTHTN